MKNIEAHNEKFYQELINLTDITTFRQDMKQYKKTKTKNPETQILQFIQKFYSEQYNKLIQQKYSKEQQIKISLNYIQQKNRKLYETLITKTIQKKISKANLLKICLTKIQKTDTTLYKETTQKKLTKKELLSQTYAFNNGYRNFYNLILSHATANHKKPYMVYSEYKPLHQYINFDVLLKQLYGNAEDIETLKQYNLNIKPINYIKKGLCKYTLALKGYRYLHEILNYGASHKKFYEMVSTEKNQYLMGFISETQKHLTTSKLYRIIYELLQLQKTDKTALSKLVTIINREPQRLKIIRRFTKTKNETKYQVQKDIAIMISRLYQKFKNDEGNLNTETQIQHSNNTNNHDETVTKTAIPTQEKNLLKWYIENSNRNLTTQ